MIVYKYLQEDYDDEMRAVTVVEIAKGMLDLLGGMACMQPLVELRLHIVGAIDLLEHSPALLEAAPLNEAVGCVHREECPDGEQHSRDADKGQ